MPPQPEPAAGPDIDRAMLQLCFAETIGWIIDRVLVTGSELTMSGWALAHRAPLDDMRFLINGVPFQHIDWPLPSQDVGRVFNALPYAQSCRFICRHTAPSADDLFVGDYACLAYVGPYGSNANTYRRANFILNPSLEPSLPDHDRINRVISGDVMSYAMGGATLAKRLDAYLVQRFGRGVCGFDAILDWGCGAGRLTRHLARFCPDRVTGIDIDADNIGWCRAAIQGAKFLHGPLMPPLQCADGSFDLVTSISVFTHLDEATQLQWLAELRRIVRPGGIVLASVLGLAQMALYRMDGPQMRAVGRHGFLLLGQNSQLDGFIDDDAYYKNVAHSPDYILSVWSRYFDIVEIVESIATHQDLVVMVRRDGG